jgi:hypothetical protein
MLSPNLIDFHGIGGLYATFVGPGGLDSSAEGTVVKLSSSKTVAIAESNDVIHGVIKRVEKDEAVGVQIGGYVEVAYNGATAPTVGYCKLSANSVGGLKVDDVNGREYLVVNVDAAAKIVGFFL